MPGALPDGEPVPADGGLPAGALADLGSPYLAILAIDGAVQKKHVLLLLEEPHRLQPGVLRGVQLQLGCCYRSR